MSRIHSYRHATMPLLASALALTLSACGGVSRPSGGTPTPTATPAPTPAPTPTPTPTGTNITSVDPIPCINQTIPTNINRTPAGTRIIDLLIPDTLFIYPELTVGYPNGRMPNDPVIDITLGVALLNINAPGQNAASFAAIPLNPATNDETLRTTFPFAAPARGTPPIDPGTGTNFQFDLSPISQYVQTDRMGRPAVATALILGPRKNAYNDGNVQMDTSNTFAFDLINGLTTLAGQLDDDIRARGLIPCAVPRA